MAVRLFPLLSWNASVMYIGRNWTGKSMTPAEPKKIWQPVRSRSIQSHIQRRGALNRREPGETFPRFHWNGKQVWWLPFFLYSWTVECETFKQTHVLQRDDLFMTINWISFDPNGACHTTANSPLEQLFTNTFRKADSVFRVTSFKPNLVFHSFWLYFL